MGEEMVMAMLLRVLERYWLRRTSPWLRNTAFHGCIQSKNSIGANTDNRHQLLKEERFYNPCGTASAKKSYTARIRALVRISRCTVSQMGICGSASWGRTCSTSGSVRAM